MTIVMQLDVVNNLYAILLLQEALQQMAQQLDICQKALSQFLEDKRSAFPRFYFIGDDDLLEVGTNIIYSQRDVSKASNSFLAESMLCLQALTPC